MLLRLLPARGIALLFTLSVSSLRAQTLRTGRIVGRVIDASTGQGITDAGVQVVGTTLGVQSGVDGRFSLANVPAGTVTLSVRRLGFTPKTVMGLQLDAGQTLEQSVSLTTAAARIAAQVVTASVEPNLSGTIPAMQPRLSAFFELATERVMRLPGVTSAAAASAWTTSTSITR